MSSDEQPVKRSDDLDDLHSYLMLLSQRIHELGLALSPEHHQEQHTQARYERLLETFHRTVKHLDGFIPGGCPDEPDLDDEIEELLAEEDEA